MFYLIHVLIYWIYLIFMVFIGYTFLVRKCTECHPHANIQVYMYMYIYNIWGIMQPIYKAKYR
jgi:hypothetical protein